MPQITYSAGGLWMSIMDLGDGDRYKCAPSSKLGRQLQMREARLKNSAHQESSPCCGNILFARNLGCVYVCVFKNDVSHLWIGVISSSPCLHIMPPPREFSRVTTKEWSFSTALPGILSPGKLTWRWLGHLSATKWKAFGHYGLASTVCFIYSFLCLGERVGVTFSLSALFQWIFYDMILCLPSLVNSFGTTPFGSGKYV